MTNTATEQKKCIVCVLDIEGNPLMPTTNCRKVRKLLQSRRAIPVCDAPFTIQLTYEIQGPIVYFPMHLGIDTGRENIGIAITTEQGSLIYAEELKTNNKSIKKLMQERRMHRQSRHRHKRLRDQRKALKAKNEMKTGLSTTIRSKQNPRFKSKRFKYPGMEKSVEHKIIKGAEARFNNRKRPEGWLTPSGRQLIQTHINIIRRLSQHFPLTDVHIERVSFDFQKIENEDITSIEYSKGPLYGYKDEKDLINDLQGGKCLLCDDKKIDQYHHIVPRHQNGSNTINNLAGLCTNCHSKVHTNLAYRIRLSELKSGMSVKYKISLLNSIMPQLLEQTDTYCKEHSLNLHITTGYETSEARKALGLSKEHFKDAFVISLSDRINDKHTTPKIIIRKVYESERYQKRTKAIIHQLYSDRVYIVKETYKAGDETVTKIIKLYNRHPSTCQSANKQSLHDYMDEHFGDNESAKTKFAKTLSIDKTNKRTYKKQGFKFKTGDKVYLLRGQVKRPKKQRRKTSEDGVYTVIRIDASQNRITLQNIDGREVKATAKKCQKLRHRGCVTIHSQRPI